MNININLLIARHLITTNHIFFDKKLAKTGYDDDDEEAMRLVALSEGQQPPTDNQHCRVLASKGPSWSPRHAEEIKLTFVEYATRITTVKFLEFEKKMAKMPASIVLDPYRALITGVFKELDKIE